VWPLVGSSTEGPLLVAHRGGEKLAGGDVLEGIRRAIELGFDAIEFDVRRTGDGTLVVHHDEDWDGTPLAASTYGALRERGAEFPTLAETLDAAGERVGLDVELKEAGYEPSVVSTVLEAADANRVVFTSFRTRVVRAVKRAAPGIPAGLLIGRRTALWQLPSLLSQGFPVAKLEESGCDFLAVSADLRITGVVRRAQSRGVPLLIWGVDDPGDVGRYLREPSVIGVVTGTAEAVSVKVA
jgi:glycerophosphoryl diester phosphodiesterase